MPIVNFDSKIFNPEVFGAYMGVVPRTRLNMILQSGIFSAPTVDWAARFSDQAGGYYGTYPFAGRIDTDRYSNFDGQTKITTQSVDTWQRSVIAYGRAEGFEEKDFTPSISSLDPWAVIAAQLGDWEEDQEINSLMAVIRGIFAMPGTMDQEFVTKHSYDISGNAGEDGMFGPTTINTAVQRACGDAKDGFSAAVMHSAVLTRQENLNLLERLKYTDAQGVQRDLTLGTLNGRLVLVDDGNGTFDEVTGKYTTYIIGSGMVERATLPVRKPYTMSRVEDVDGGIEYLWIRMRRLLAPYGFSFTKAAVASLSPLNDELALGANWELAKNFDGTKAFPHKTIKLARVISNG